MSIILFPCFFHGLSDDHTRFSWLFPWLFPYFVMVDHQFSSKIWVFPWLFPYFVMVDHQFSSKIWLFPWLFPYFAAFSMGFHPFPPGFSSQIPSPHRVSPIRCWTPGTRVSGGERRRQREGAAAVGVSCDFPGSVLRDCEAIKNRGFDVYEFY